MSSAWALALASMFLATTPGCRPIPAEHDPYTTADRSELGLPILDFQWKFPVANRLGERKPQEFASPVLYGAQVFVGSATGMLHALSADDGTLMWSVPVRGLNARPVVDARGRLYVGTIDGAMLCLQASNGKELWRYNTRGSILEPPVLVDGLIVFSNEADQVYALDSESGEFRWQYKGETPDEYTLRGHAGVAVADGLVFSGFANGTVVALRQNTGSVAWIASLKGEANRFVDVDGTPVVSGSTVYVTSSSGGLHALDRSTGLVRWRLPIEGASGLTVDGDRIYVAAANEGIHAVDPAGNIVWRQGTRGGGEPARPVVSGNYLLYTLSEDGMFIADKRTGKVEQYFDPGDGISSQPTVDGERLYVLSNRGILYALNVTYF